MTSATQSGSTAVLWVRDSGRPTACAALVARRLTSCPPAGVLGLCSGMLRAALPALQLPCSAASVPALMGGCAAGVLGVLRAGAGHLQQPAQGEASGAARRCQQQSGHGLLHPAAGRLAAAGGTTPSPCAWGVQVYKSLPLASEQRELHGTEIAALAGPVLATLLNITSLFILFYKTLRHSGTGALSIASAALYMLHTRRCAALAHTLPRAGFAYGFINSAYLHQGLFVIVTSYLLQCDRDLLSDLEKVGEPPLHCRSLPFEQAPLPAFSARCSGTAEALSHPVAASCIADPRLMAAPVQGSCRACGRTWTPSCTSCAYTQVPASPQLLALQQQAMHSSPARCRLRGGWLLHRRVHLPDPVCGGSQAL